MTTITLTQGCQWGNDTTESVYCASNWGAETTEADAEKLGDACVAEFERRANQLLDPDGEHEESVSLIPGISSVIGDANADYPDDLAETLDRIYAETLEWAMANMGNILE